MRKLYECRDRLQAQMLQDDLSARHIKTVIQGDYLSGAAGELSAIQFPVLWIVEDGDYDRGRELIEQYLNEPVDAQGDWQCSQCGERVEGNFDICWKCLSPRD
ncbi:putative signal transducing protein [Sedimenticola selenatireducens]|uniref:DUF2007 domain-containing protein n=1 Tax=Sedimenticola selenatireducens TaxID=191960 RepID=A0A557SI22_9GAMM|nr:DUF2007 domain-containing protein [Sedimenticola selenatireducens]TVO77078.1 DUF2007 domain-containing protein [Sedimenticola selenatireducens]TVT64521.1 MAG: DUF2007 domain-containing protein [Sedimenticola selenatireducens]